MNKIPTLIKFILMGSFVIFLSQSCVEKSKNDSKNMKTQTEEKRIAHVRIIKIEKKPYSSEIISNGTLEAAHRASLKFKSSENIDKIYVNNGDRVKKGQKIAMLEQFNLKNSLDNAKNSLDKSELDLQNVLISQGYSLEDSISIPKNVMSIAKIKSGYNNALNSFKMAEYNYKNSVLYAPFSGVVGNIISKENNYPESGKAFCTVIDNSSFDVVFMVLESDLYGISQGDKVKVFPYAIDNYQVNGKIKEINPIVDENGMIRVVANVANTNGKLFDGMNISVKVECQPQEKLIIPKSALVLRSGRKVVFTVNKSLAQWNYVEVGEENSDSYVILKGLNVGDSVIYDGNMDLADQTPVKVVK